MYATIDSRTNSIPKTLLFTPSIGTTCSSCRCLFCLFFSHNFSIPATSQIINKDKTRNFWIQNLSILCSFVMPTFAPCWSAAFVFPLSFLAAFSLAISLWLPLAILAINSEKIISNSHFVLYWISLKPFLLQQNIWFVTQKDRTVVFDYTRNFTVRTYLK